MVGQKELETFREEMEKNEKDPFKVVVRQGKLPLGLLSNPFEVNYFFRLRNSNMFLGQAFQDPGGGGLQAHVRLEVAAKEIAFCAA